MFSVRSASSLHRSGCACCAGLGRRGLLAMTGAVLAAASLPAAARAEDGTAYEAMLLTCIDPRFVGSVNAWMDGNGLRGKFSQFAIAGATVGVVAQSFAGWHAAFWDNLGASMQLHQINRVIAVAHRDCGAAAIAYGNQVLATREAETALHQKVFGEFRAELAKRQPTLGVQGVLMALDGSVETLG